MRPPPSPQADAQTKDGADPQPQAVILAIGDELLSGELADTNSAYLDAELERLGWRVREHRTVADDGPAIAEAFLQASARAELVISTGGLGPTQDDITLASLADALGCPLRQDAAALAHIQACFARLGREMTDNNRRQAQVPATAEVLINEAGTAPGIRAQLGAAEVYCLPGVPREVRWLMTHQVAPRLARGPRPMLRKSLAVVGLGESRLETALAAVIAAHPQVRFGFRTHGLINDVKLACRSPQALAAAAAALPEALGPAYLGETRLEAAVGEALCRRGQRLAVAESLTAGALTARIARQPGASAYLLGGVVAYDPAVKTALLGVPADLLATQGAVNKAVARAMAEGVRRRLGADHGLATTGLAGPGQGGEAAPVGTVWIALATPDQTTARQLQLGDRGRAWVQDNAATAALDLLRRTLHHTPLIPPTGAGAQARPQDNPAAPSTAPKTPAEPPDRGRGPGQAAGQPRRTIHVTR